MPKQMSQQTIKRKLIEQLRIRQENNRQLVYLIDAKAEVRKIAQETGTFYDVKEPEEE